jgi:hypothetical protein
MRAKRNANRIFVGKPRGIVMAQDRGQWRVLVNTVMNFPVP